jgi:hypothetical protein
MKQVFVQNDKKKPLEHDYDIMYDCNKRVCLYSNNSEWAEKLRTKIRAHIIDNGDGVHIKIGKESMDLDYADYLVLKILIASDLKDNDHFEIRESKTIKKWGSEGVTEIEESLR